MIKINNKYGVVFWVTGLAGSGKTTIAKKLKTKIQKKYGPTIVLSGDEIRSIFNIKGYDYSQRLLAVQKYQKIIKKLSMQKINVIFAVIGMIDKIRKKNKILFKNYVEIYITANFDKLQKKDKKKLYSKGKNVVGKDIKPELPKSPNIKIKNDFKELPSKIADKVFIRISKILNH